MTVKSGESVGTVEVTPSGIPVYYQSKPKRLYKIRPNLISDGSDPEGLLASVRGEYGAGEEWIEVPSVTTVLGVLDKPALVWWGQEKGIEGLIALYREHGIPWGELQEVADVVGLLTKYKLTVNHVRDKAGDRGQAVHDALESWARHGHMPDPKIYPEEQEGYVRGLVAFLKDLPTAEPVAAEVLVASPEHGYAGRYDLRVQTSKPHDVVVRQTATRKRTRELLPGTLLVDLKTSKGVYPSHARQLEAYEQASIESGYGPTDGRGILLVGADGTYEFVRSWATFEDFRVVLDVWRSDQRMAEQKKSA